MKNSILLMALLTAVFFTACTKTQKIDNPFFTEYATPFEVPPFDKIDTSHYLPAFIEGINQHNAEIKAIAENSAAADFDNTIIAFDKSGKLLSKVSKVFFNLQQANTNDQIQAIAKTVSPMMSKHSDDISMNAALFARIKAVYDKRNESNLDEQQIRVVEKYYKDFERQGANLAADKQDQLRKINEKLAMLSLTFGENMLAESNKNFKLLIDKKEDLAGLPEDVIAAAAETADNAGEKGKWVFTLAKSSWIPFLQYADNRELREKLGATMIIQTTTKRVFRKWLV